MKFDILGMNKKIILSIVGVIFFLLVVILVLRLGKNETPESPVVKDVGTSDVLPKEDVFGSITSSEDTLTGEPVYKINDKDKDADGIDDEKEKELGTSDYDYDTDGDGLSDESEVNVWKTDPTKLDSDGDGFNDGYEVINGYNPNGSGKLEQKNTN